MADHQQDIGPKKPSEIEPLLPQPSSSSTPVDRPRTVRHHRRALSGRSTRSGLRGQISFGPTYHPNIYPSLNDPFTRQAKQAADGRARSRFVKALLAGISLWIVIGLVFGWAGLHRAGWGQGTNRVDYGAKPSVPRSEGRPVWCAKFESPQSTIAQSRMPGKTLKSTATISIPLSDYDSFFIHGQGSFAKGHISIDTSDSQSVEIDVTALTNDEALVDLMTVCHVDNHQASSLDLTESNQLSAGKRNVGLGIYTPAPEVGPYPDSDLEFRVQVKLPKHLTSIYQFSVKGDLFAVTTADLSAFSISQVDITTTVASITVGDVISKIIKIRTNNGQIEGSFHVSDKLSLVTTNGAINAHVGLTMSSTQGLPASGSKVQSLVTVDVATINGAVSVNYIEHPVNVKLFSYVQSTNGRAHVEHLPAYEGDFEVETTWGSAEVKGPLSMNDPSGQARDRQKFIKSDRDELGYRLISGTVWWGENDDETRLKKAHSGHTLVKTTLGSARATFQ